MELLRLRRRWQSMFFFGSGGERSDGSMDGKAMTRAMAHRASEPWSTAESSFLLFRASFFLFRPCLHTSKWDSSRWRSAGWWWWRKSWSREEMEKEMKLWSVLAERFVAVNAEHNWTRYAELCCIIYDTEQTRNANWIKNFVVRLEWVVWVETNWSFIEQSKMWSKDT